MSYGLLVETMQRAVAAGLDGRDRPYGPGEAWDASFERLTLINRIVTSVIRGIEDVERSKTTARRGGRRR